MARGAHDSWIEKVLGFRIPGTGGTREQPQPYARLLQRWQDAQAAARQAAQEIGKAVLALPEVQADPRFSHARDAVGMLPGLVPDFGAELASLLRQGSAQGEARTTDALALVATCRQRLADSTGLGNLERFARKHVGDFAVQAMLDGALADVEAGLKTST